MIYNLGGINMSKAVYKNAKSEKIMLDLYNKQALALSIEFEDIY